MLMLHGIYNRTKGQYVWYIFLLEKVLLKIRETFWGECPPSKHVIYKIVKKFLETKSVLDKTSEEKLRVLIEEKLHEIIGPSYRLDIES